MRSKPFRLCTAAALCFCLNLVGSGTSSAGEQGLTPARVVAAHLRSLGSPERLAGIKNRGMSGTATVKFIQGGVGTLAGAAMVISSGRNLSIIMKYGAVEYPGEYFAHDGADVEVSTIKPGQRSPLGDFIFRYKGIMKEGLMGGVWSLGWPLLNLEARNPSLEYRSAKVDGRELHELEYIPKGGLNDIKVRLFFEPETFRHVRTEYRLRVEGGTGAADRPDSHQGVRVQRIWPSAHKVDRSPEAQESMIRFTLLITCSWRDLTTSEKSNSRLRRGTKPAR